MDQCAFNMHDFQRLDFDVQMIDCKGTWAAPLWMSPNHWEGGGESGEIDMLENCWKDEVRSNFAGGGTQVKWTDNGNDFTAHVTMWKQDDGDGVQSIHINACQYSDRQSDGTCPEVGSAYLRDIYGKFGCSRGDCVYHMISDIWNGVAGDGGWAGCTGSTTNWGSQCKFSITNIRTKGIPFTGKCAALSQGPSPSPSPSPTSWVSISSQKKSDGLCLDLTEGVEADGTKLQVWECNAGYPGPNQRWLRHGTEIVHRTADGRDLCVDIPSNDHSNGNKLQVWSCAGSPQQQWERDGETLRASTSCMDLTDGVTSNGNSVQIWDCGSGNLNQQWTLSSVSADDTFMV